MPCPNSNSNYIMIRDKYYPLQLIKMAESLKDYEEDFENPEKKPRRNKYAFACAILASMTSILLGYGEYYHHLFSFL